MLVNIKEQREGRRITNKEIAKATGVSMPTITRWMRNEVTKIDTPVLEAFCKYFECDIADLLYLEPSSGSASIKEPSPITEPSPIRQPSPIHEPGSDGASVKTPPKE